MAEKEEWIEVLGKAINEMEQKKIVLLKRGDLIKEEMFGLYKDAIEEFKTVAEYLNSPSGDIKKSYRYLQMNVFMKHESFFMDLFETNEFPYLFELFEFE